MGLQLVGADGRVVGLPDGRDVLVGRRGECDVRIDRPDVFGRHCVLKVAGESVLVAPLDRRPRTFVNGQEVNGPTTLRPGDELWVAGYRFVLSVSEELASGPDPGCG